MKNFYYALFFILLPLASFSQEICGNGLDDDGDGYVDQFDVDCYPGAVPACFADAPSDAFGIQLNVQGPNNQVDVSLSPTIGDIDGDGIPEIIAALDDGSISNTVNVNGYRAYKVSGSTVVTVCDFTIPVATFAGGVLVQPAIADIDSDGTAEVICVHSNGFVYVFGHTGGTTSVHEFVSDAAADINYGSPRVIDIDEDGVPEIIVGNDVFKFNLGAGTLTRVIQGSNGNPQGRDNTAFNWGADIVVIDILASNPGKEIVAGSVVYAPNMGTGTLTVLKNLNTIDATVPLNADGPTAVADLDLDGDLDIAFSNGTRFYIWDLNGNALLLNLLAPSVNRGMPTIAYVYNDVAHHGLSSDYPEVIQVYANIVRAYNLHVPTNVAWSLTTTDNSGETGITAFDFNGDAIQEIVYNDEQNVRIINGDLTTPVNLSSFTSGTATWMEHPVVADVDDDGQAEIITATGAAVSRVGRINIFNPIPGNIWQPAREVWNQRGYRVVNVHDDLTIPAQETDITNLMPAASAQYRVLNQYNAQFNPNNLILEPGTVAATDAQLNSILLLNNGVGTISLNISIVGGTDLPMGTAITVYDGNPTTTNAPVLTTIFTNAVVPTGTTVNMVINCGQINSYDIYCVVNDDGSAPRPFSFATDFPTTGIAECNYANNMQHLLPPHIDSDGDGATDNVDLDLDNDGILNSVESSGLAALGDEDGDGTINCQDVVDNGTGDGSLTSYADANGNGVPDAYDTDGDGVVDIIDLDSDNDGIYDRVESGETTGVDANADGRVDGACGTDGVPDAVQAAGQENSGTVNYTLLNTDAADNANYRDLDSDNDNCSDANEYYNSATADGNDGGVYGTGTPVTGASGKVTTATYTGSYALALSPATLAVITSNPPNVNTVQGSSVYFTAGVTNGSGTTSYQWQVSTDGGTTWTDVVNDATYSGATSLNLLIANTPISLNNNRYRLMVSQSDCACKEFSSSALLTVNASADSDSDGVPNTTDLDDDNDGILDADEGNCPGMTTNEAGGTFGITTVEHNLTTPPGGGYTFSSNIVNAGDYAVVSLKAYPIHPFPGAWQYAGHTSGDSTDAFLAVNGSTSVGTFYSENLNFTAGATYVYSIWHAAATNGNPYQLGIRITRVSDGALVASANSPASGYTSTWKPLQLSFTSNTTESYKVSLVNVSVTSSENDFAIDDVTVTPLVCGTNSDGTDNPDGTDLDSDNDGCADVIEAGHSDPNHDGIAGGTPVTVDANGLVTSAGSLYLGTNPMVTAANPISLAVATPPSDQTTTVGSGATFSVTATVSGPGSINYQWQVSTDNGTTWTAVTNGATYSGVTTSTLAVSGVTAGMNGYDYRVRLTQTQNLCDTVFSVSANLLVNIPPVANDDNGGTLTEDGPNGTVAILTNDTDGNGNPTAPTNGGGQFTVDLDTGTPGVQTTFTDATGVWTYAPATGIVTFDPATNYNGPAATTK